MAFENINVSAIRSAVSSGISDVNDSKIKFISVSDKINDSFWKAQMASKVKSKIIESVQKHNEIVSALNIVNLVCGKISQYKQLENQKGELLRQIDDLTAKINEILSSSENSTDVTYYQAKIEQLNLQVSSLDREMRSLENEINSTTIN